MPPQLPRWLVTSLGILVKPIVEGDLGVQFYIEGVNDESEGVFEQDSVVLRINGPWFDNRTGEERIICEVLLMITDLIGENENAYKILNEAGTLANTLSGNITVNRHGDEDPATTYGILVPDRTSREFVRVVNYGILDKDMRVKQCAVIARYELSTC